MGSPGALRQTQGIGLPVVSGPTPEWNPGIKKGLASGNISRAGRRFPSDVPVDDVDATAPPPTPYRLLRCTVSMCRLPGRPSDLVDEIMDEDRSQTVAMTSKLS